MHDASSIMLHASCIRCLGASEATRPESQRSSSRPLVSFLWWTQWRSRSDRLTGWSSWESSTLTSSRFLPTRPLSASTLSPPPTLRTGSTLALSLKSWPRMGSLGTLSSLPKRLSKQVPPLPQTQALALPSSLPPSSLCTSKHNTTQHNTTLHNTTQHYTTQHYTTLHNHTQMTV